MFASIPFARSEIRAVRGQRWLLWGIGIGIAAWGAWDPRFRDVEGFPTAVLCFPLALSAALLVLGWGATGRWRASAGWFALALVGQAAALQLIDAGMLVRWQHYRPLGRLLAEDTLFAAVIVIQGALVAIGLAPRWPAVMRWLRRNFRLWQLGLIAGGFWLSSAALQRDVRLYVEDLVLAAIVQTVSLATIVLMVWALPDGSLAAIQTRLNLLLGSPRDDELPGVDSAPIPGDQLDERPGPTAVGSSRAPSFGIERRVLLAAVWVTLLAAGLSLVAYDRHPHITDEVAYLYHARFLAAGALTLPAPPVPEAFDLFLMERMGDRWHAPTPPGWPAMLAVGVRLGVPWLINPVLAGLNLILAFLLLRALYGRWAARLAVLLLVVSPWYVFMAMNFMTHTFALTCTLAAALGVVGARRTGRARWALIAGFAVGIASLIRPVDGVLIGGLIGLWAMGVGGQQLRVPALAAFGLSAVITGALVLPYNQAITGRPTVFPLNAYVDRHFGPGQNDLGFGPRGLGWPVQPFPDHTPVAAVINANLNTFSLNVELFGWGTGSLLLVLVVLLSGRLRRPDYLMVATCAAVFVAYFFYYFSGGPDFGARYWYLMLIPLVALTVRGIRSLQERLDADRAASLPGAPRVLVGVLALSAMAVLTFFPWRVLDKYHHFWGMRPDVRELARVHDFGKSLVLIRGNESHPDYASAAIYNPLDWQADAPVYAWDRGSDVRERLLAAFPERPVWIVESPSMTGTGYRVVAGPLPPLLPTQP